MSSSKIDENKDEKPKTGLSSSKSTQNEDEKGG